MSEETKDKNLDFVVNPLSDEELEDESGGNAPESCSNGSCSSGTVQQEKTVDS
jgi:hypothetical protein